MKVSTVCVALAVLGLSLFSVTSSEEGDTSQYHSAVLETCGGWRLNRLPKVKSFINHHLPEYPDVDIKYLGGKDPEMVFRDEEGKEVERTPVANMDENAINELLTSHGFFKKVQEPEPEPEEEEEEAASSETAPEEETEGREEL